MNSSNFPNENNTTSSPSTLSQVIMGLLLSSDHKEQLLEMLDKEDEKNIIAVRIGEQNMTRN